MLDLVGLVHMGGRIYDPINARFLSPDPFVQSPDNLQNLNRYSYVLNNPLSYTDPSGFFFKGIEKFIGKHWKTIAAVGIGIVTGGLAAWAIGPAAFTAAAGTVSGLGGALSAIAAGNITLLGAAAVGAGFGFGSAFSGTLLAGGSVGDALRARIRGGVIGGISGGAANWVGGAFASYPALKTIVHGVVQGGIRAASGGKFTHGFLSASFADMAGGLVEQVGGTVVERTVMAAVIGGTAELVGGGKFANGAVTGAFVHLFNHEAHRSSTAGTGKNLGWMDDWVGTWSDDSVNAVAKFDGFSQDYIDTLAGFENEMTFGLSNWAYEKLGLLGGINQQSKAYSTGGKVSLVIDVIDGVAAAKTAYRLSTLTVGSNGLYYDGRRGAWSYSQVSQWYREVNIEMGSILAGHYYNKWNESKK